jgi:Adenylate and Guanylate cyclase catalytic domain
MICIDRRKDLCQMTIQEWLRADTEHVMLAIVFTDIVGSTALQRELGDQIYNSVRREHFKRARHFISAFHGYEIKTIGDSFYVVFRTAVDAFDFAIDLYTDTGHDRVKLRVGIHVGAVHVEEGKDIYGNAVNYTKRAMDTAKPGGIVLSHDAMRQVDFEKAPQHQGIIYVPSVHILQGFEGNQKLYMAARKRQQGVASKIFFGSWSPDTKDLKRRVTPTTQRQKQSRGTLPEEM